MGRLRGCLWLTAGLVLAVLAGAIAYITLNNAAQNREVDTVAGPTVQAVVALRAVAVRSMLVAEDVELREFPVQAVPEGALQDVAAAVGKITLVDLYPGEVILQQRLVDPNVITNNGRYGLIMAADQVLMAFPAGDLMSRIGVLKAGDRVDILVSLNFEQPAAQAAAEGEEATTTGAETEAKQITFNLLQAVSIAAVVSGAEEGSAPVALLLTISPQDALILKYAKDAGGVVDIVLRAPGVEEPFEVEPIDVDYVIDSYRLPVGR